MPRFFDELMISHLISDKAKSQLKDAVVIDATNVSNYYFEGTSQEKWDVVKDFPNVAPPFPLFFVECEPPEKIVSSVHGVTMWDKKQVGKWGCLIQSTDMNVPLTQEQIDSTKQALLNAYQQSCNEVASIKAKWVSMRERGLSEDECLDSLTEVEQSLRRKHIMLLSEVEHIDTWEVERQKKIVEHNIRWSIVATAFMKMNNRPYGPLWLWQFAVDNSGVVVRLGKDTAITNMPLGELSDAVDSVRDERGEIEAYEYIDKARRSVAYILETALLAISFMHCKNVIVETNEQTPKPLKSRHIRHGMKPRELCTFHTLKIEPLKTILRREGDVEKVGLKQSLHICRGHFRDYTEGRGLFGKYHGVYWQPMHVKGRKDVGSVEKDYSIELEKKQ